MIGYLPTSLEINGTEYAINTDFRVVLTIFEAFEDAELTEREKSLVLLYLLFEDADSIPEEDLQTALRACSRFLDGLSDSREDESHNNGKNENKRIFSWVHDEKILFSAINKVAGFETRAVDYLHWWTFLGYFNEIGEGMFSTVIGIRQKKAKGKKLDKWDEDFYRANRSLIDLPTNESKESRAERDYINKLINGEV